MKTLTCKDLGGACDEAFTGATLDELGEKCRAHAIAAMDDAHKTKMEEMRGKSDEERTAFMEEMRAKFDAAPETE